MKSPAAVDQVKAIVEGFRAVVSLTHASDAQAMKLLNGLKVSSEGTKLNVRWMPSADDVWAAIEKAAKTWAEHKAKGGTAAQYALALNANVRSTATPTKPSPAPRPTKTNFSSRGRVDATEPGLLPPTCD